MRYVRTLKGLSPVPVNLVTKEMARSVKVSISVEHSIKALAFFRLSQTHWSWILSDELGLAYTTGLSRGICSHALLFLMIFLPGSLNSKLLPATGITAHLNE